MQVSVHLRPHACEHLDLAQSQGFAAPLILETARDLGVQVRQLLASTPEHTAPQNLRGHLLVTVPDQAKAAEVIARFKALDVTESAYLKPDAAPPGPRTPPAGRAG